MSTRNEIRRKVLCIMERCDMRRIAFRVINPNPNWQLYQYKMSVTFDL